MRIAETIQDVAELLSDYNVEVCWRGGDKVEFDFPKTQEEKEATKKINRSMFDNFSCLPKDSYTHFVRKTRYVIRGLVSSPRFWRLTTVADQLGRFVLSYNKQDSRPYGIIKARKKANENLCIVFEDMSFVHKFFRDLKKTKLFKEVK